MPVTVLKQAPIAGILEQFGRFRKILSPIRCASPRADHPGSGNVGENVRSAGRGRCSRRRDAGLEIRLKDSAVQPGAQ
jgi:hypothetical protein